MSRRKGLYALVLLGAIAYSVSRRIAARDSVDETLLLGYGTGDADGEPGSVERYGTVAIDLSKGALSVITEVPGIIIPLSRGFDRMGVTTRCDRDSSARTDNYHQAVWRGAATEAEPASGRCADRSTRGARGHRAPMICDDDKARIVFGGRRFWADEVTSQRTDDCEPRGDRYETTNSVHRPAGGEAVRLDALFDPSRLATEYAAAMQRGFDSLKRDGVNCPPPSEYSATNWDIRHRRGRWVAMVTVKEFAIRGQCQFSQELGVPLPDSVAGESSRGASWSALSTLIPDLDDYVASPDGAWVLAFSGKPGTRTLSAWAMSRSSGRKLWERPIASSSSVVMARWSSGRERRRWLDFIGQLPRDSSSLFR